MKIIKKFSAGCLMLIASGMACAQQPATKPADTAQPVAALPKGMPAVEPAAIELVRAMSNVLGKAKTIQFDAIVQSEYPSIDGIQVMYTTAAKLAMQRPNKFDVVVSGNGAPHEILFNGKQLFAYVPDSNIVAVTDCPDTIDTAAAFAYEKAGLFFPGDDLILSNPFEHITEGVTDAFVVGKTKLVGGVETDIVVMAGNNLQGQLWIGTKDHLPYMASWVYLGDKSRPRTTLTYKNWKLNATVPASTFDSVRFSKALVTEFSHPEAPVK
jgi:hypothetical protein